MKIVLIGCNSFLAKRIGQQANKLKSEIMAFGKKSPTAYAVSEFIFADLSLPFLHFNKLLDADLIFYCAGAGVQFHVQEDENYIYQLNVTTPINIAIGLEQRGSVAKFITFGSYFEIGINTNYNKEYTEDDLIYSTLKVTNSYTVSKRMLTRFFDSRLFSLHFNHFILPTIYGEGESDYRLIPYTISAIKNNQPLKFTSGDQLRQYIYIDDVVDILFQCHTQNLKSGIFNIGPTEEFKVKDLVRTIFNFFNADREIENCFGTNEQRSDVQMKALRISGSKLSEEIGETNRKKLSQVLPYYKI